MFRIGLGTDIHRFDQGSETRRKLILGGIEIPHSRGLLGHSDSDCVLHAVGDALLGALALGDLGRYFPGDEQNLNRSSREILFEIVQKVWNKGYKVSNVDIVVNAEEPKLMGFREEMEESVRSILNADPHGISIKFKTADGLGAIGRKEGISAQAVVLLEKKNL